MVILIVLLALPATTASAAAAASISLTAPVPNPGTVGSEVSFDLAINVTDINPGVAGAEVYLGYNPALVSPPSTPNGAAEVLPDFFGTSNISINEVLPAAQCPGGTSPCIHLVLAGPPQVTHNAVAARFHFRGLAEGSACFTVLQSVLVDANGFNVTHTPATQQCATIKFLVSISGVAQRQGVPANPNTGGGTLSCTIVTVSGTANAGPINTDATGAFKVDNLQVGTYTFRAVYPGYLATEKAGVIVAANGPATINLGITILRGGDVNGDNAINILDIGAIISKFGKTGLAVKSASVNCSGADESADINDDAAVTISDLAIAAGNWGKTAPTAWQQ